MFIVLEFLERLGLLNLLKFRSLVHDVLVRLVCSVLCRATTFGLLVQSCHGGLLDRTLRQAYLDEAFRPCLV